MKISVQEISIILVPIIVFLVIYLCLIPANIAAKKGYSKGGFFIFAMFLWIPALIVALCISDKTQPATTTVLSADELTKYKNLLDQGVITQAEYEAKKKQILG